MLYFSIDTIKASIERLQAVSANWLLPAFVFAANDVGTEASVNMSQRLGTDRLLDRYFNGKRLGLPTFDNGNNVLRPRQKEIAWDQGTFAGDYIFRQRAKLWANQLSSRGYRDMRIEGQIEGNHGIVKLTDTFKPRLEAEISPDFRFEDLLVWLYAFEGFSNKIKSWQDLFDYLLNTELNLERFNPAYRGRFKLSDREVEWPAMLRERPSNDQFLESLAPQLVTLLADGIDKVEDSGQPNRLPELDSDDLVLSTVNGAIDSNESLAFLLAGPPGTGKTRYARQIANHLTGDVPERLLLLQFHPAIGYDDFVEGFRPTTSESGIGVRYELAPRLFLEFARRAALQPSEKFVAVIDELNRGDVARIFGELFTYIEVDYRGQEFSLSYSGDKASIPRNLIIIATANPFDRSVTDLDDALLRRFWVIELQPDGIFLRNHLETLGVDGNVISRTMKMFQILNDTMPAGFGHTAFLKVRSLEDLASIWSGRIHLVLKRAFMHDRPTYESTSANIEQLLSTRENGEPAEESGNL